MKWACCLWVMCGLLLAIAPVAAQDDIYWPEEMWRTSTPEAQGMDSALLAALLNRFQPNLDSLHSLLVIRNGYLVLDASVFPFSADQPHWQFSATKSVVSTLIGIAIEQGYITGIDQSIWDFFSTDDVANMDDRKEAITIGDLLMQASGLQMSAADDITLYGLTDPDQSWVHYILDQPMAEEPGTRFNYLDANPHLLSAILTEATGMSAFEYAQANLFAPLGITEATWRADPQGINLGGGGLALSPYSMAKLGYLYLHRGIWNDQAIVPEQYVAAATTRQIEIRGVEWDYGYLWWTETFDRDGVHPAFAATGLGGQEVWVVPDRDLVVVLTGNTIDQGYNYIDDHLIPASLSDTSLPENPDALSSLNDMILALQIREPQPINPISDEVRAYSGQVFNLDDNPLGWEALELTLGEDEGVVSLVRGDERFDIPFGLDRVERVSSASLPVDSLWLPSGPLWRASGVFPIAARGNVMGDDRVAIRAWDLSGGQSWSLRLDLGQDLVVNVQAGIAPSDLRVVVRGTMQ